MLNLKTSKDSPNVISLQASEGGLMLSDLLDGQMLPQCGQGAVPVNLSVPQVTTVEPLTPATCGQRGSPSSRSVNLQLSLENKLKQLLNTDGSMECRMTWNQRVTPLGRQYCQLVASGRPISESDYGLWLSPTATVVTRRSAESMERRRLQRLATGRSSLSPGNIGELITLYLVPTIDSGDVNPELICWLMGYPEPWNFCGATVMQSYRKLLPSL